MICAGCFVKAAKYSELANFLAKMEKSLEEFEKQNGISYHWRFTLYSNYSYYYLTTKDLAKAELYVQKMAAALPYLSNAYTPFYLKQKYWLLDELGRYKEEVAVIDTLETMLAADNWYMRQTVMKRKIYALGKSGQGSEAANLFDRYCDISDSLNHAGTLLQLNELRTKYDINKLEMQKERNHQNFLFALSGVVLLLLVLGVYIYYSRLMTVKNRAMVKQIKEMQEQWKIQEQEILAKPLSETEFETVLTDNDLCSDTRRDKLCLTLRDMMLKEHYYRNPNLTRDDMITKLGTNKALFAESFQYCFGTNFSAYINHLRLKDAINLLENSDLSLEEIADKVGFGTLRTFQRQFRNEYGMAISDFRKLAK
jgi:AraC-like DNA-binding protein